MNIDIKKIDKSPMFQLSLGSKELFHSNFLYWLSKAEPNAFWKIMYLFGINTDDKDSLVVKREWNHFDLSIVQMSSKGEGENEEASHDVNDILAVIENKVKSIPDKHQMERYAGSIAKLDKKQGCVKILLSLIEPEFDDDEWTHISYERYLTNLRSCMDDVQQSYNAAIFTDYCNMVDYMIGFKNSWIGDEKELLKTRYTNILNSYNAQEAAMLRINDLRHKLIYSVMLKVLAEKLSSNRIAYLSGCTDDEIFLNNDNKVVIGTGMTRAMGLIELKVKMSRELIVGVQVQSNQYRHFVIFKDNTPRRPDEIKTLLRESFGEERSFEHQGRKSMGIGSFTNKFKYVYKVISDQTIENVIDNILSDALQLITQTGKNKII